MPERPGFSGQYNSLRVEREMVWYICTRLGSNKYADGKRVGLNHVIEEARARYYPVSQRHLYRWISHYIEFGETPEESRRWRKKAKKQGLPTDDEEGCEVTDQWSAQDTAHLEHIIDHRPWLYLDERE